MSEIKCTFTEDAEITKAVLSGDIDRYSELVGKYQTKMYSIVAKRVPQKDVDSVANEIFVQAYNSLSSYSGKAPFGNWVSRIAVRTCCLYWRRQEHYNKVQGISIDAIDGCDKFYSKMSSNPGDDADSRVKSRENIELLKWVLNQLSPEDRTLIESVYLDNIPLKDVAISLDWNIVKAKVRACRARKKMRKILESIGESL